MDTRQANQEIKTAENEFKSVVQTHLIEPLNIRLNRLQIRTGKEILDCLKNPELKDEDAYLCKAEAERKWLDDQDRIVFFAKEYNLKLSACLGECKHIMSQPVKDCYLECLSKFKDFALRLEYE